MSESADPQLAAEERGDGASSPTPEQRQRAVAEERRMLLKERLWALGFIGIGAALGWMQWHELRTEHTYSVKAMMLTAVCAFIGPAALIWPKLLVGMGRHHERVAPAYRELGYTLLAVGAFVGFLAAWHLGHAEASGAAEPAVDADACDFAALDPSCSGKDLVACAQLAQCLAHATDSRRDDRKAVVLYQRACDGGVISACGNLGFHYSQGRGIERDTKQAFHFYELACNGGSSGDCSNLANLFELGDGVRQDFGRARALFAKSCNQGDSVGCTGLGRLSFAGAGGPRDDRAAAEQFRLGCDKGDPLGCGNLGFMTANGRGIDKAPSQARSLYERACDGEIWEFCTNLGIMLANGDGGPRQPEEAARRLATACEHDDAFGCFTLALMRADHGQPTEARVLFDKACKLGNNDSCAALAKHPR